MSFRIGITPRDRRVGRFIARVQSEVRRAFAEEQKENGLTQQELANRLGMDKGSLSRRLSGQANLTLATIAELAHGLNRRPAFSLVKIEADPSRNHHNYSEGIASTENLVVRLEQPMADDNTTPSGSSNIAARLDAKDLVDG